MWVSVIVLFPAFLGPSFSILSLSLDITSSDFPNREWDCELRAPSGGFWGLEVSLPVIIVQWRSGFPLDHTLDKAKVKLFPLLTKASFTRSVFSERSQ